MVIVSLPQAKKGRLKLKEPVCKHCGAVGQHYSTFCIKAPKKALKRVRRPRKNGKEYERWRKFREEVAIPYMDKHYGHFCRCCKRDDAPLDIDHIIGKGSNPALKYQLSNLQYLDRVCHYWKTNYPDKACPHIMIEENVLDN